MSHGAPLVLSRSLSSRVGATRACCAQQPALVHKIQDILPPPHQLSAPLLLSSAAELRTPLHAITALSRCVPRSLLARGARTNSAEFIFFHLVCFLFTLSSLPSLALEDPNLDPETASHLHGVGTAAGQLLGIISQARHRATPLRHHSAANPASAIPLMLIPISLNPLPCAQILEYSKFAAGEASGGKRPVQLAQGMFRLGSVLSELMDMCGWPLCCGLLCFGLLWSGGCVLVW